MSAGSPGARAVYLAWINTSLGDVGFDPKWPLCFPELWL
jgi:hypothetical protein